MGKTSEPSEWQQISHVLRYFGQPFSFVRIPQTEAIPLQLVPGEESANDRFYN